MQFKFVLLLGCLACSNDSMHMLSFEASLGDGCKLKMMPVTVKGEADFWIAETETTWEQYLLFQNSGVDSLDGITGPTPPYVPMNFGMGVDGYPAISMTHFAARQFCRWLSNRTGHFYRLPTHQEWMLACADSEPGWCFENSDGQYQKCATSTPNQFGLHDMLGNVAEWVDDFPEEPASNWGHLVCGGSWDDDLEDLSASSTSLPLPIGKCKTHRFLKAFGI